LYYINYLFTAITGVRIKVMIFKATFNNISVILWPSVLLVEETGVPGENNRPAASHWQTLSHYVVSSTPRHERHSNWDTRRNPRTCRKSLTNCIA